MSRARFFVDENDLALGRALAERSVGVLFPGHPSLPEVPRGTPDEGWLPIVAQRRLAVITRDQRIRYRPVEKAAWMEYGVVGFVLTGRTSQSTMDSLSILERHWVQINAIHDQSAPGPWMYAVTTGGVRRIDLL